MRLLSLSVLPLLGSLAFLLGCSGGESSDPLAEGQGEVATATDSSSADAGSESAAEQPVAEDVKKVPSASLPPTQGTSPTLDGGRLKIPLLSKWSIPPRTSEWLFRLQRDRKTAYPQILITVDESFTPQVEKLNKTNVGNFVVAWQKHLDKKHKEKAFGERVSPVRIGKRYGAECLIHSIAGKLSLEQLMVTMVGAGRVYTLELRAQQGTLEDYRMDFYAVVAGTVIELPATTPGGLTPMDEVPAEAPAEEAKDAPPAEKPEVK